MLPRLIVLLMCLLFHHEGWATKARIAGLGGGERAHRYFNDSTNIFINPAYVNSVKDFFIFEWGGDYDGPETVAPKAEGGIIKSGDAFVYGLYLGREDGYVNRSDVTATPKFLYQDNAVEVFLGGDMGSQWGASVKYSQSHDNQQDFKKSQDSLRLNMGLLSGNIEGFLSFDIFDRSRGGESYMESFRNEMAVKQGFNYLIGDLVLYETFERNGYKHYRKEEGALNIDQSLYDVSLGGGQSYQINEKSKCYVDVHYRYKQIKKRNNISGAEPTKNNTHLWRIPLTFAVESQVLEWLALRASLAQNLVSNMTNDSKKGKSEPNTTSVNAGASLVFGGLRLDGLIGASTSNPKYKNDGVLTPLFTEVGLIYQF